LLFVYLFFEIRRPRLNPNLERLIRFTQRRFSRLEFQVCGLCPLAPLLHCSQQDLVRAAQPQGRHRCAIGYPRRRGHDQKKGAANNTEQGVLRAWKGQEKD